MDMSFVMQIFSNFVNNFYSKVETLGPQIIAAILVIIAGTAIAYGSYQLTMYIFKRFNILDLIDKIWAGFEENTTKIVDKNLDDNAEKKLEKRK